MGIVSGGGGGSATLTPPVTLTGTDPATVPLTVRAAAAQSADVFDVKAGAGGSVLAFSSGNPGEISTITIQTNDSGNAGLLQLLSDAVNLGKNSATFLALVGVQVIHTGQVAAPVDAQFAASDFALWLDATPAATKLMVKAKDSGGTVRTAAIALA